MRIVIIANESNGLYLFRRHLITALIKQEHEVIALTPFDTDVDNLKALGMVLVETTIDRRGTNPIKDYSMMKVYKSELRRLNPDLVITYTIKPNVYGGIVCRQLKIPYVTNITGLGTAFESSGVLRKLAAFLYKVALKGAKVIFFENSANRDYFVDAGIIRRKQAHVLRGAGVDLEYFSYMTYPKEEDRIVFLFVGRIMNEKGVHELLEATKRLKREGIDCYLQVLGGFEEKEYKSVFAKYEAEGWLEYYGVQNDIRPFIEKCHCFVLPSWHEGMANTLLECAACGRPIITSNIPGCREAVIEGQTGLLCERKNVDSLYKKMRALCEMPINRREMMGMNGRKHMANLFDKKKVVDETILSLENEAS